MLHWVTSLANTESFHQKDNCRVLGAELSVDHFSRMCEAPCSVNSTVTKLSDSEREGLELFTGREAEIRGQPLCCTRLPADGLESPC